MMKKRLMALVLVLCAVLFAQVALADLTYVVYDCDDLERALGTTDPLTIVLGASIEYGSLRIPSIVTLDLKGNRLRASNLVNTGTICDSSSEQTGCVDAISVQNGGTIRGGTFENDVSNESAIAEITGGTFSGRVTNDDGFIRAGTFTGTVNNIGGAIIGGTFGGYVTNSTGVIGGEGFTLIATTADALKALCANAASGATIKLAGDITLTDDMTIASGVTLDLNGKTLDGSGRTITNQGTISDSDENGEGKVKGRVNNKGVITGGTFTASSVVSNNTGGSIKGGTYSGIVEANGGTVGKDGITITATSGGALQGLCTDNTQSGTTIKLGQSLLLQSDIVLASGVVLDVNGQTLELNSKTISGSGSITNSGTMLGIGAVECNVTVTSEGSITNGTYTGTVTNSGSIITGEFNGRFINQASGSITGGSFGDNVTNNGGSIVGSFSVATGTALSSLASSATGTSDITLFSDIALTADMTIDENVILYLNGKTITGDYTITNNGTINAESYSESQVDCAIINNGTLAFGTYGGTITNNGTIYWGTYNGTVTNGENGTLQYGAFNGAVTNYGNITNPSGGGISFAQALTNYGTIDVGANNDVFTNIIVTNYGTIKNGAYGTVNNYGTIKAGSFSGTVTNSGDKAQITGGYFYRSSTVTNANSAVISGGDFYGSVENSSCIKGGYFGTGQIENSGSILSGNFANGCTVINLAAGTIDALSTGDFSMFQESVTVLNAGAINAGYFCCDVECYDNGEIANGTFDGKVLAADETTVISGGTFNGRVEAYGSVEGGTFNQDAANLGSAFYGTISDGTFNCEVFFFGTKISGGTFTGKVHLLGPGDAECVVSNGTFTGDVYNICTITGGTFENVTNASDTISTGCLAGGTFNGNVTNSEGCTISDGTFNGSVTLCGGSTTCGGTFPGTADIQEGAVVRETACWKVTLWLSETDADYAYVLKGQPMDEPDDPVIVGQTFGGWYQGDTLYSFSQRVNADMELTAAWDINTYTVTLDVDGKTTETQIVHGKTYYTNVIPSKDGYVFVGWYANGVLYDFTTPVTSDMTLTARWVEKTEQLDLTVGETYYFDLSSVDVPGTPNANLPDATLHYVPFRYMGTVYAYQLTEECAPSLVSAQGASASEHSLFLSEYNLTHTVTWAQLNKANLIFGQDYTFSGLRYDLRAASGGSNDRVIQGLSEWSMFYKKDNTLLSGLENAYSWAQDSYDSTNAAHAVRGYRTLTNATFATDAQVRDGLGYRPVLDATPSAGQTIASYTLDLNGGNLAGKTKLLIATRGTNITAPAAVGFTAPIGKVFNSWLGADGKTYAPGEQIANATNLTAQWADAACTHDKMTHVPAKEATTEAAGNTEYWYCPDCGKYFADEAGTKEITLADTVIPKQSDVPKTGDESPLLAWVALLVMSGCSLMLLRKRSCR